MRIKMKKTRSLAGRRENHMYMESEEAGSEREIGAVWSLPGLLALRSTTWPGLARRTLTLSQHPTSGGLSSSR